MLRAVARPPEVREPACMRAAEVRVLCRADYRCRRRIGVRWWNRELI